MTTAPIKLGPGLYHDMPMTDYLRVEGVNHSLLKEMFRSPAHYLYAKTAPPSEPSEAMTLGTAVHLLSLEPELFGARVVEMPDFTIGLLDPDGKEYKNPRNTSEYRRRVEAHTANHPGAMILPMDEYRKVFTMADAIRRHKTAGRYSAMPGRVEVTIVWRDPETGILCKGRIDKLIEGKPLGYDIKTTRDANIDAFNRAVASFGYHSQAAWYRRGLRVLELGDIDIDLVVVENVPPYGVRVGPIDDDSIAIGAARCDAALRRIRQCEESGAWPGYDGDDLTVFGLPEWEKKRLGGVAEEVGNGDGE